MIKTEQQGLTKQTKAHRHWLPPVFACLALFPISQSNMALFHTLVELFAIVIATMSFIIAWHTFSFSRNRILLFLGCGYFWIGIIDLLHTLSFQGAAIIHDTTGGLTIQLWVVARYLEAFLVLAAPMIINRQCKPIPLFIIFGCISILAVTATFSGKLPNMYIPGEGLTDVKIFSEYIIIGILVFAFIGLAKKQTQIKETTKSLLLTSIVLTILAEVCFTLYSGLGELPIVLGHLFKLLSFWAVYIALIKSSLLKPFQSLTQVVNSYDVTIDPTVVINEQGIIHKANKIVREQTAAPVMGNDCHDILHPVSIAKPDCSICKAIAAKASLQGFEYEDKERKLWYEASLSGIQSSNKDTAMVHILRDITFRKRAEQKFSILNRLYRVLSHCNQAIARTQNREVLLQKVCDIAIEHGGFKMAWIGYIEGLTVQPTFISGTESGYLKEMKMRIDSSEWSKGPVGTTVATKKVACVNNVKTEPDFAPWRSAAIERDYASLAAVPLLLDDQVVAVFTLYSTHEDVFDNDMLSLLSSLSDYISGALFHFEQAQLNRQAESTILKLSSALEQSEDAVIISDPNTIIEYVNPKFVNLTGYSEEEIIGQPTSILKADNDETHEKVWVDLYTSSGWRGEIRIRKKDGDVFWSMQSISPIKNDNGEVTHFVSTSSDNSKLHEAQDTIKQLAFYDPLTKLANRRLLMDRLEHDIISAQRHNNLAAVLLCDLDNFKTVNDSLGHDYGDILLQHVSDILTQSVRAEDTVARLGGDEFTLVVSAIQGEDCITKIADTILARLKTPITLSGKQIAVSSSIGIAIYPQDGIDSKALLRNADLAMYHAKAEGKNNFQFYQQEMNEKAHNRLILESKLKHAIKASEFELHYQPQVNISNGNIIGFEALIRWRDSELGLVPPNNFIPLAEETGLISEIGEWVIKQAYRDWQALIEMGFQNTRMAVNVAAHQFRDQEQLCNTIKNAIQNHPMCPANMFTVELTESTLIDDIKSTVDTLNILKTLGVSLSIDDFGTGYSSLNYLQRFPFDQLKIDKSFVQDLSLDENVEAITSAILIMANKLGMKVIAEGIEEQGQSDFLLEQGCELAQGFLYYKPMPLNELQKLTRNQ